MNFFNGSSKKSLIVLGEGLIEIEILQIMQAFDVQTTLITRN
jgi:pyruvate/2-oxoglutarate dehydrogenase complex dihydrolipoamide dehydrogenase (E3) component